MAEPEKQRGSYVGGAQTSQNLITELKNLTSVLKTRKKTMLFIYFFMFTFFALTTFLAFSPANTTTNNLTSVSISWYSNIFSTSSFFLPNKNQTQPHAEVAKAHAKETPEEEKETRPLVQATVLATPAMEGLKDNPQRVSNYSSSLLKGKISGHGSNETNDTSVNILKNQGNDTAKGVLDEEMKGKSSGSNGANGTSVNKLKLEGNSTKGVLNEELKGKSIGPNGNNGTDVNLKKNAGNSSKGGNGTSESMRKNETSSGKDGLDELEGLMKCDVFQGRWVKDEEYPLYKQGSCPHIDESFNCFKNGRVDDEFQKLRWQPSGCNIPRLSGENMLELLRGKRLVFVGDSLNRNMWESLVCILRNSVEDKSKVYEASGRKEFKTQGSYLFKFPDYNATVEFFRSPFLVQEWEMPDTNGKKKETLRLDLVELSTSKYKDADFIVFNTGHWWTHDKTSKGQDYYQEGNHVYKDLKVLEAYRKALTTWARWVDTNINQMKTSVFFRGYSSSHFSGGQWNSGGQCNNETEPIRNETYLSAYPPKMRVLESVIKNMKTPVYYMNITRMTDYRKDAHPSVYRKQHLTEEDKKSGYQDCSHWCLPGVPDTWNEILYAQILIKQRQKQIQQHEQEQHHIQEKKQKLL